MATVVANAGRQWLVDKVMETITAGVKQQYWGWGTAAGTAAVADTTLFTEDSAGSPTYARIAGTITKQTTTVTGDTYQVVSTITSNGSKSITNAGIFDALTVGVMSLKGDFSSIPLLLNDAITFTGKIQIV